MKHQDSDHDEAMGMASMLLITCMMNGPFRLAKEAMALAIAVLALLETRNDKEKASALVKQLYPEMITRALDLASEEMSDGLMMAAMAQAQSATKQ